MAYRHRSYIWGLQNCLLVLLLLPALHQAALPQPEAFTQRCHGSQGAAQQRRQLLASESAHLGNAQAGGQLGGSDLPPLFDYTTFPKNPCANCNRDKEWLQVPRCCGICEFEEYPPCNTKLGYAAVEKLVARLTEVHGFKLDGFTPKHVLETIKGRTLWIVGDSQSRHWYNAIECFMRELSLLGPATRTPVSDNATLVDILWTMKPKHKIGGHDTAPACLNLPSNSRVCGLRISSLATFAEELLPAMIDGMPSLREDIMVVNKGLIWFNEDLNEKVPLQERYGTYRKLLSMFTEFVVRHRAQLPQVLLWKDTAPQHFDTPTGAFTGKLTEACPPLPGFADGRSVVNTHGGAFNMVAAPYLAEAGIPVLNTWNITAELHDYHMRAGDCTHYCNPSAYHIWLYLLDAQLQMLLAQPGKGTVVTHTHAEYEAWGADTRLPAMFDSFSWPLRCWGGLRPCKRFNETRGSLSAFIATYEEQYGFDFHRLTPERFLAQIRGRTLWLIGDTQAHRWFQAIACFMYRLVERPGYHGPTGVNEQNVTVLGTQEAVAMRCLRLPEATRICVHLLGKRPAAVLPSIHAMEAGTLKNDIMVVNQGYQGRGKDHRLSIPLDDRYRRYRRNLQTLTEYIHINRDLLPRALIWKDTAPQHWPTDSGLYNGTKAGPCVPLQKSYNLSHVGDYNLVAAPYIAAAAIPALRTWEQTAPLWQYHAKPHDCITYCAPSAYSIWTYMLSEFIDEQGFSSVQQQELGKVGGAAQQQQQEAINL